MLLDHITIRTQDLSGTRDFMVGLFGLEEQDRPKAIQHIPGHWLYSEGKPIVHLIGSWGAGMTHTPEGFDHVGFRLENYKEFRERLDTLGINYSLMELPELNERRIFFHIPNGPLLETVFDDTRTNMEVVK